MTNLVALCGRKGSGKSYLSRQVPAAVHLAFADPLREVCAMIYGIDIEIFKNPELKEKKLNVFPYLTPRKILQTVGTEGFRAVHPETWSRCLINRYQDYAKALFHSGGQWIFVVDDLRFPDERRAIADAGGVVIKIINRDVVPTDNHESESYIDSIEAEFTFDNTGYPASAALDFITLVNRITARS